MKVLLFIAYVIFEISLYAQRAQLISRIRAERPYISRSYLYVPFLLLAMTPYQYQPLDDEAEHIRLLYLLPSETSTDIRVDIIHTRLTKEDVPKYEALSYAWGESDTPEVIYVGQKGDVTMAVTRSLYQALPHLRYKDQRRVLWVDAICVDQQNLKERGLQVERMGDIYSLAEQVIVWLGLGDSTSAHAIQFLHTIASKIEVDWIPCTIKPRSQDDAAWADTHKAQHLGEREVFAILSLVMRPWFERLWVQQEIHAKRNVVLICGSDIVSWQDFRQAIYCFYYKLAAFEGKWILYPGFLERIQFISRMVSQVSYSTLGELMKRTQECKCSDPRDRVFGVLNMLEPFERNVNIKPDYTKTVIQVYWDAVLSIVNHTKRIIILEHCEMQEQPLESSDSLQFPSWVRNWTIPVFTERVFSGRASCNSFAQTFCDNDVLRVMGTHVARIGHVEKIKCYDHINFIPAIRNFSQKFLPDIESASYVSGGSKVDAYCRTLCSNYFVDQYVPARASMPGFQQSREWLLSILNSQETDVALDADVAAGGRDYLFNVWRFCSGRNLFMTEEGYIGLAPRAAKAGDCVCVLLGSNSPFLLHPTGNNQYQIVGHCYAHGIMSGEALLGPLPGDYRSVFAFDRTLNRYSHGFHSPERGTIQWSDPRLPFKSVYEPSERQYKWVIEEQTALTSEALEKRGVHMEMFELI